MSTADPGAHRHILMADNRSASDNSCHVSQEVTPPLIKAVPVFVCLTNLIRVFDLWAFVAIDNHRTVPICSFLPDAFMSKPGINQPWLGTHDNCDINYRNLANCWSSDSNLILTTCFMRFNVSLITVLDFHEHRG